MTLRSYLLRMAQDFEQDRSGSTMMRLRTRDSASSSGWFTSADSSKAPGVCILMITLAEANTEAQRGGRIPPEATRVSWSEISRKSVIFSSNSSLGLAWAPKGGVSP